MVDAADSKSARVHALWGFDSPLRHQFSPPHDPSVFKNLHAESFQEGSLSRPSSRAKRGVCTGLFEQISSAGLGPARIVPRSGQKGTHKGCPYTVGCRARDGVSLGLPEHQAQGQRQQDGFQARSHLAPRGFAGR